MCGIVPVAAGFLGSKLAKKKTVYRDRQPTEQRYGASANQPMTGGI